MLCRTRSRPSPTWRSRCATTGRARSSRWRPAPARRCWRSRRIYRLIKFGGARRVLFLVDRAQPRRAGREGVPGLPHARRRPQVHRAVQRPAPHLEHHRPVEQGRHHHHPARSTRCSRASPSSTPSSRSDSQFDDAAARRRRSRSRSSTTPPSRPSSSTSSSSTSATARIYSLWRQVLEYFDAYLIGLTATPAKHTFGFFNQNLVMEYRPRAGGGRRRQRATSRSTGSARRSPSSGATIEAGTGHDGRLPRPADAQALRWEAPDEDVDLRRRATSTANVVATTRFALIVRTFRDKLFDGDLPRPHARCPRR